MFEQAFKNIDDVLWKDAGCTSELDYTEQTSWLLFLKYLDGLEEDKATEAALDRKKYNYILDKPYRWETWAAPKDKAGQIDQTVRPIRAHLDIRAGETGDVAQIDHPAALQAFVTANPPLLQGYLAGSPTALQALTAL